MGIQKEVAQFVAQLPLPKRFAVCELGDQGMCGDGKNNLAKDWYEQTLGYGRYVSIDGNGRGTVTLDLNLPIRKQLEGAQLSMESFDLVTDFGTGEHIFDQAQIWRTLHWLVKPNGYIAFDRPAQGYQKHCYYLANECLFREIAEANAYNVIWLERAQTPRGELIRGVFWRRGTRAQFNVPQQGRYLKSLVIPQ